MENLAKLFPIFLIVAFGCFVLTIIIARRISKLIKTILDKNYEGAEEDFWFLFIEMVTYAATGIFFFILGIIGWWFK